MRIFKTLLTDQVKTAKYDKDPATAIVKEWVRLQYTPNNMDINYQHSDVPSYRKVLKLLEIVSAVFSILTILRGLVLF